MTELEWSATASRESLERDWRWLAPTLSVVEALLERDPSYASASVYPSLSDARALTAMGQEIPTYPGARPKPLNDYPTDADVRALEPVVAFYRELAQRAELTLCVLRSFLACWRRDRGALAASDPLYEAFNEALAPHRAHREKERAHAIAQLESNREYMKRKGDLFTDDEREQNEARLRAVRALSDDALLCDRSSTTVAAASR